MFAVCADLFLFYVASFCVHSPALLREPAERELFYSDIPSLLQKIHEEDKVLILSDLNRAVGQDSQA